MSEINQANYNPSLTYTARTAVTFSGTTVTITDANIKANSMIVICNQSSIPAGHWSVVPAAGSCLVTSSDAESLTFKYMIC